ncbi:MAG: Flp pilus assembly complex ATPase component TadA [Planctomycetes bacterium]|nr:Flp pilus assembly complex ATPase component TadA [Planctomycetota bacterium]
MAQQRRKLGEILKQWGRVTDQQIEEALKIAAGQRKRIGATLVELGYADETDVAKALASQYGMAYIDLDQPGAIKKEHIQLVPRDLIRKYLILPLGKENGRLKLLIHDPVDLETLDNLRFRLGCDLDTSIAARSKIKEYIDHVLSDTQVSIDNLTKDLSVDRSLDKSIDRGTSVDMRGLTIDQDIAVRGEGETAEEESTRAPIIRLVEQIIREAVESRASDIHIEPFVDRVRLRYRIDGVCHEREKIPKRTQSAVIARLKILAGVKIEEKRIPQDGRIKMKINEDVIDFRFAVCPAYHGESIVMRILRPDSVRLGLENLGLREDTMDTFNKIIRRPNGILLVTGPTGSGKTTTLYSALNVLNRPDKKIITAEDPVEYNFKGINQCQVNEHIGLTFSKVLRAMLRQAPNIVLVGEIRDKEVADVAIQAALTGHLVFSTLHTNDAPSAITRLIDMGVKPFLVASSIQAVLAQRLVRILCEHCKQPDDAPNPRLLKLCGFKAADLVGKTIYKPVGCSKCGGRGYRGRRGIYEMMIMNSELRELAFKRSPVNQIRVAASNSGMRNLLGDGRLKILDGFTTPDEIASITQVEGVVDDSGEEETTTITT